MNFRTAALNSGSFCHSFILCHISVSFFGFITSLLNRYRHFNIFKSNSEKNNVIVRLLV